MDFALYRELLQNSADAKAENVVISFTEDKNAIRANLGKSDSIENLHDWPIEKLTVRNDGQLFKEQDWSRLKEIAKGNPDETKIGAFGVGFYSVFELTDEPLVHSGDTIMSFYYQGDQLHFRRIKVDEDRMSKWTVIDLPYRSPGKVPALAQFTAFLTQSFMLVPLLSVTLELDGLTLLKLSKTTSPSFDLPIPKYFDRKSPNGTLSLETIGSETFQVSVKYMNVTQMEPPSTKTNLFGFGKRLFASFVTTSKDPAEVTEVTCFLRKVTAVVSVKVSSSFASKIKQAVMKPPPRQAVISMLTYSKDEEELSELKPPLSDYIMPKEFNDAKIFIGFPTKQSTSFRSHIAMNQLIPTMERTAIDMSNAFVKDWNEQLLYMGGAICRVVYENEMTGVSQFEGDDQLERACHTMSRFEFDRSTPDASVGVWISAGFWSSSSYLSVPTTNGIKYSSEARVTDEPLFLKLVNQIPQKCRKEVPKFIENAAELGLLKNVDYSDIVDEVQGRAISPEEFVMLSRWCSTNIRTKKLSKAHLQTLLGATVISNEKTTIPLGLINRFQNRWTLSNELPLPESCIPYEFIKHIPSSDLDLFQWKELSVLEWLDYIVCNRNSLLEKQNLVLSAEFATVVLKKVSDYWHTFNIDQKEIAFKLLRPINCIPTQLGMKQPHEAYLKEIPLFPYLPVKSPELTASYDFLFRLGLRESVDMAFVLEILHNPEKAPFKWTTVDVVKYLTANRKSLKASDWDLLRKGAFFEGLDGKLYQVNQLYAPHKDLVTMNFQTLKWEYWNESSAEASLLHDLGLRKAPPVSELFRSEKKSVALHYFISHFEENHYSSSSVKELNLKTVPCLLDGKKTFATPLECYSESEVSIFGFPVVEHSIRQEAWKLGVQKVPTIKEILVRLIENPPKTMETAETKFSYLATRVSEITEKERNMCINAKIIPIQKPSGIVLCMPSKVFIGDSSAADDDFFNEFFDFSKFSLDVTPFLLRVGARQKPDLSEVVAAAVDDPLSMYQLASTTERYQRLLLRIALEWNNLSKDVALVQRMKTSKFLIGQFVEADPEDGQEIYKSILETASRIMILDDVIAFNLFKDEVKVAPQSSELEGLYSKLGSMKLSDAVETVQEIGQRLEMNSLGEKTQQRIRERGMLFLEGKKGDRRVKPTEMTKLQVVPVKKIFLRRRIHMKGSVGAYKTESITASLDSKNRSVLYCVLERLDWFDVSQALVKEFLKKPNPDSVIVLELQLKSDLKSLQKKGYNVDRLLQQKRREDELAAEERDRLKSLARERLRQKEESSKDINGTLSTTVKPEEESLLSQAKPEERQNKPLAFAGLRHIASGMPESPQSPPSVQSPQSVELPSTRQAVPAKPQSSGFMKLFKRPQAQQAQEAQKPMQMPTQKIIRNTAPDTMLQSGIRRSGAFNSNRVNTNINNVDATETGAMHCDYSVAKDLQLALRLPGGPRCFIKAGDPPLSDAYIQEAQRFKDILFACSQVG